MNKEDKDKNENCEIHTFQIKVSGCTIEQAERVIAERLSFDEDYGFKYSLEY